MDWRELPPDALAALDEIVAVELAAEQYAAAFPLAGALLWRPRCERWRGLAEGRDDRPEGCGAEMVPTAPGRFTCPTVGCKMHGVVEERTSQRDIYRDIAARWRDLVAALVGGANRAGKTEGVMQLAAAMAAGGDQPWVQAWLRKNDLPLDLIPDGPGTVWVSALTFNDSLEYHRPKLDAYLPEGTYRRNWNAENQAKAILPNGGQVVCKAAAQGRGKFQGASVRLVVLDEEHDEDIYEESLRATAEAPRGEPAGLVLLSMTPLKGVTWPHRVFVRASDPEHYNGTITGLDNPHVDSTELRKRFKHLPKTKQDARLWGKWATAKGAIYPSFSRQVHVIDDRDIPAGWARYRCIDFGLNFACVWAALDPDRDQLHIYRAYKSYDVKLTGNARQVKTLSAAERYRITLADPADKEARDELRRDHALRTVAAKKPIELGIDAVHERLALTEQGYPRLVFHRNGSRAAIAEGAPDAIEEMELYKRDEKGVIVKANDHLVDCIRYIVYHIHRSGGGFGVTAG